MAAEGPHVSIAAETLTKVAGFPITNALISTWVVMGVITIATLITVSTLKKRPGYWQIMIELLVGGLYNFVGGIVGKEHVTAVFPISAAAFIFILTSNWFGLLPGVGSFGIRETESVVKSFKAYANEPAVMEENTTGTTAEKTSVTTTHNEESKGAEETHVKTRILPLFRAPTADLNLTIGLALVTMAFVEYYALKVLGLSYLGKFFNFKNPGVFILGILELVSEFSRVISFAFRLFGNVFAGEVLLTVMTFLVAFLVPAPFYGIEVFVGVIQAFVFAMLAAVFTKVALAHGEHAHSEHATEHAAA